MMGQALYVAFRNTAMVFLPGVWALYKHRLWLGIAMLGSFLVMAGLGSAELLGWYGTAYLSIPASFLVLYLLHFSLLVLELAATRPSKGRTSR